jgi:O-antigen/teichoic acid export membrane protein
MNVNRKVKQLKNSAIYMLPVVFSGLLPLITLPIFTRILTPEDYGIWGLSQVYASFVIGIANFGLTVGYERNFFENKDTKERVSLLYSTQLFVIISIITFGLITFILKAQLSEWIIGSSEYSNIFFLTYCVTGIMGLKSYFLIYFKNTENAKSFTKYTITESILVVITSLFLVIYLDIGIIGLVWGQFIGSLVTIVILSYKFIRFVPPTFNGKALKESLKISVPLTPRIFFGLINNQFDKYMIGLLSTIGGVGVYNIGQKISNITFTFMTSIQNVFAPEVYKRMFEDGEEGKKSIGNYLTPFFYASISVCFLISLFSEEIITLLTPASYHKAIDIVIIFSMLYGTYFFGKQPQLIYMKKTYITSILTLVSIGINIAINIPFITKWGVIGAAWGTLLAGIISGCISFVVSQYHYRIEWEYKKIGSILLLYFGTALGMIMLRYFDVSYWIRGIVKLLLLTGYLILGMRLNLLTKQNLILVKSTFISAKK